MNNKKILILGSGGTLGQALIKELSDKKNYQVIAWDRAEIDITNFAEVKEKILSQRPDIIINAVAHNAVDKIETEEAEFLAAQKINGEAVKNLALLAKELGSILIHYSSDYVFAGIKEAGYTEAEKPEPLNKYGQTKWLGEQNLLAVSPQFYLIRLSKLFSNMHAGPTSKKSFVETMLGLFKSGKQEFELVDDEFSSPTYAPDLAKFTVALWEENQPWGIYHGANSGGCTWYLWAQEIFAAKKMSVVLTPVSADKFPRPAARPHQSILLNTKRPAQRSWQEALREALLTL